jgi:hypothetical protein
VELCERQLDVVQLIDGCERAMSTSKSLSTSTWDGPACKAEAALVVRYRSTAAFGMKTATWNKSA